MPQPAGDAKVESPAKWVSGPPARPGLAPRGPTAARSSEGISFFSHPKETYIAALATVGILLHLALRYLVGASPAVWKPPLCATLIIGGIPLVVTLSRRLLASEFSSDLLAGLSILTAVLLKEYLVASIVVLMLSGGTALEQYATRRASSVLDALARRMPRTAHRKVDSRISDVELEAVVVGDTLVVFPHEICPLDGEVVEGHGVMDEAYLTGERFQISKSPGSQVLSGAINGDSALTIVATKPAVDSRHAKIMRVMQETEQKRPRLTPLSCRPVLANLR